jgi:phage gp45-like
MPGTLNKISHAATRQRKLDLGGVKTYCEEGKNVTLSQGHVLELSDKLCAKINV